MAHDEVYILGAHTTVFGKHLTSSPKDLTREAYLGAVADAGLEPGAAAAAIGYAAFGNCLMGLWGQEILQGQTCFIPLVREGLFGDRTPIINVEGGCATGSIALASAFKEIRAGFADVALAIGVEKLHDPTDPARVLRRFSGAMDMLNPEEWQEHYAKIGGTLGSPFEMGEGRSIAMDTYALQARLHMKQYGTTVEQIAAGAAKNHTHGSMNPKAQYRFTMTPETVLADRQVNDPFTRAMCAPISDGAAAAIVCSGSYLARQPEEVRTRAVRVRGIGLSGGKYRRVDEPSLTRFAAERAYAMAGIDAADVDLAEVHDATAFCEIFQMEMLGFCPPGEGGPYVASGATTLGGERPVNTSGGLVSKGHPLGATGISMCAELVEQLRGEAGERQVEGARIGLAENGGGVIGLEEAVAAVTILEAPAA